MRYRNLILCLSALLVMPVFQNCKKETKVEPIVKYARYKAAVYKDMELKTWAATLSKTEPVFFIESMKIKIKGKDTEVCKVNLSDYTTVYIKAKHLADQPVVFIEDTKAYVRNNLSSSVYAVIPRGSIGFIEAEQGEWTRIYAGKIGGKWVTRQWVRGGFSSEASLVQEARTFEESADVLNDIKSGAARKREALERLRELSSSQVFANLAEEVLKKNEGAVSDEDETAGKENSGGESGKFAVVTAQKGLKIRKGPGIDEQEIAVIPEGGSVKIVGKGEKTETIAGKTSHWYEVIWMGKQGWVFGGFLEIE